MFSKLKFYKIFCFLMCLLIFGYFTDAFSEEVSLSSDQIIPIFLEQSNPVIEIPFDIDISPFLLVDAATSIDSLIITLIDPQGQIISSNSVANFNGEYLFHEIQSPNLFLMIPSPTFLVGHHYTYHIQNPSSGNWKINITCNNIPIDGIAGVVTLQMKNDLKIGFLEIDTQYVIDSSIPLIATVFDSINPVLNSSVTSIITNLSDNQKDIITLKDDGNGADNQSGDGLYSAGYIPINPGEYSITTEITGVTDNGTSFNKSIASSFTAFPPLANFNGSFFDQGMDINGDSFYDYIALNIGVNVNISGSYRLSVSLKGNNNITESYTSTQTLSQGINQTITVNFPKENIFNIGVDGPYNVAEVSIELFNDGEWCLADKIEDQWETQSYSLAEFEEIPIQFTGNNSDTGNDINGNGLFDLLQVTLEIKINIPGSYNWSTRLVDQDNKEIEFISSSNMLSLGINLITLNFTGQKIGENGLNGPYYVKNLLIWRGSNSLIVNEVHTTQQYLYYEFEGANRPPVAVAGGPYSGTVDELITFDASNSSDPDGNIVTYEWDWNGDGIYDESVTTAIITHAWNEEYSGLIRLKVTDNGGVTDIDTADVEITKSAIPGDLDGDGVIDNDDFQSFLAAYGSCNGSSNFNSAADFDGDGCITINDFRIFRSLI